MARRFSTMAIRNLHDSQHRFNLFWLLLLVREDLERELPGQGMKYEIAEINQSPDCDLNTIAAPEFNRMCVRDMPRCQHFLTSH